MSDLDTELLDAKGHQGTKGPLFFDNGKMLAYLRDDNTDYYPNCWDFPGGGADDGETVFETYRRELKEEFDLDITKEDIIHVSKHESPRFKGEDIFYIVAKLPDDQIKNIHFGNEGHRHQLLTPEEYLSSPNILPYHKQRLEEFLASR